MAFGSKKYLINSNSNNSSNIGSSCSGRSIASLPQYLRHCVPSRLAMVKIVIDTQAPSFTLTYKATKAPKVMKVMKSPKAMKAMKEKKAMKVMKVMKSPKAMKAMKYAMKAMKDKKAMKTMQHDEGHEARETASPLHPRVQKEAAMMHAYKCAQQETDANKEADDLFGPSD